MGDGMILDPTSQQEDEWRVFCILPTKLEQQCVAVGRSDRKCAVNIYSPSGAAVPAAAAAVATAALLLLL